MDEFCATEIRVFENTFGKPINSHILKQNLCGSIQSISINSQLRRKSCLIMLIILIICNMVDFCIEIGMN